MTITRRNFLSTSLAVVAGSPLALHGRQAAAPLRILILGGTGFLGPHVVERALARGHTVTLFNRGRTNPTRFASLEQLRGDRKSDLSALEGRSWDAVVDTSAYIPADVTRAATLLAPRVQQYQIISGGRDSAVNPGTYGPTTTNFDCDIVYENGTFIVWPEGVQTGQ